MFFCGKQTEERSKPKVDESERESSASHTDQKVERYLHRFFALRKMFAECPEQIPEEVTVEEHNAVMDSKAGPLGDERGSSPKEQRSSTEESVHVSVSTVSTLLSYCSEERAKSSQVNVKTFLKMMKFTLKHCFGRRRSKTGRDTEYILKTLEESCLGPGSASLLNDTEFKEDGEAMNKMGLSWRGKAGARGSESGKLTLCSPCSEKSSPTVSRHSMGDIRNK